MTDVKEQTEAEAKAKAPPALVTAVLRFRKERGPAAKLRRGRHEQARYFAEPLIGNLVGNHRYDDAAFRFAALCASFPAAADAPTVPFGRALRAGDRDKGEITGAVARRLFALQKQPLRVADSTFHGLLAITDTRAVSWESVYWTYRMWDHSDRTKRFEQRQRLLRDFYRALDLPTGSDQDTTTQT